MAKSKTIISLVSATALLGGCVTIPMADYKYRQAKGKVSITVVESIDCTADGKCLVVVLSTPIVTTEYSADEKADDLVARVSATRTGGSNSDATFTWYNDGRLKSVNTVSSGQGEAILKSIVGLAGAALSIVGAGSSSGQDAKECAAVKKYGKDKPVSITWTKTLDLIDPGAPTRELRGNLEAGTVAMLNEINATNKLPQLQFRLAFGKPLDLVDLSPQKDLKGYVRLPLQPVETATLELQSDGNVIWSGQLVVPLRAPNDQSYGLLIPKGKWFGKGTFAVSLSEAGAVTSVQYAKESATAGAIAAATGVLALPGSTIAADAADQKAKADLIAQTQRLARCRAQPDKCE